jgi:hypothetical protein
MKGAGGHQMRLEGTEVAILAENDYEDMELQ